MQQEICCSCDNYKWTGKVCILKITVIATDTPPDRNATSFLQGESEALYANIKFVDNRTGLMNRKEQLKKPFKITVTKSDVLIHYPLRYYAVSLHMPLH